MRLLDRYLLRELLVPLGFCLGGFLVFWISFDLLSQLDDFSQRHLKFLDVVQYYVTKLPELLVLVLPVALLLGLLYALTNHARHQELVAIRAAGVSVWRMTLPYFAVGALFSLAAFILNEYVVPDANDLSEQILTRRTQNPGRTAGKYWRDKLHFQNAAAGRFWSIGSYNLMTHEMRDVHVDWKLPDGSRKELVANNGGYTNNAWRFETVRLLEYPAQRDKDPVVTQTNELSIAEFSETPELIRSEIRINSLSEIRAAKSAQLSLVEIGNYFKLHPKLEGRQAAMLWTQWYARLASPLTAFVVVLVAVPFGSLSGRRNLFVGVASSIFIGFSFFVLLRLGLALGTGGYVSPWLAAWLPNLIFGGIGLWLMARIR